MQMEAIPMISKGQFIDGIDRLEAAHQRKMTPRTKTIWHEDCEDWDHTAFKVAIGRMRRFERWPNWKDFETAYFEAVRYVYPNSITEFCGLCEDGWLIYREKSKLTGEDVEYAATCARCRPMDRDRIDPQKPGVDFICDYEAMNKSKRQYSPEECREIWGEIVGVLAGLAKKGNKEKADERARAINIRIDKARETA